MHDVDAPLLYAPEPFTARDPAVLVQSYPFALLITTGPAGILATSTPVLFETDDSRSALVGHLSRRNPQALSLESGQPALAVFSGPHAYISATWYEARPTVPTWNYVAAHVRGRIEPIDDDARQLEILRRTVAAVERDSGNPWTLEQAPAGWIASLLPNVRSFRITIERIEGTTKLSQSQPETDQLQVIRHLLERGDGNSVQVAKLMMQLSRYRQFYDSASKR